MGNKAKDEEQARAERNPLSNPERQALIPAAQSMRYEASEEPSEEKYECDKNEGKEELYAILGIDSNQPDPEYLYRPIGPDQGDDIFQKRILSARIMCPNALKCNISSEGKCLVIIGASESRSAHPLFVY
jgi:hypothetical protein